MKNKIFIISIITGLFYSCINNKTDNNLKINEIELFHTDYQIINYSEIEIEMVHYENKIQKNLIIKIINIEKIVRINNTIDPIIILDFNNRKNIAKGQFVILSTVPEDCDYFFALNENNRILFFENDTIGLIGFE